MRSYTIRQFSPIGDCGNITGCNQSCGDFRLRCKTKSVDGLHQVYIPLSSFEYRFWDASRWLRDELDGIDLRLKADADSIETAKV